jgi:hypothetical protein
VTEQEAQVAYDAAVAAAREVFESAEAEAWATYEAQVVYDGADKAKAWAAYDAAVAAAREAFYASEDGARAAYETVLKS